MPYLIHNPGTPDAKVCELRYGSNTIGREQDNSIVIEDDEKRLSRHHAEITITDDCVIIKDCKSSNSTFVNDTKIARCELKDGDLIRCGSVVFKFVLESSIPEPESEQNSDLSIVRRFSPEQTRVAMQDLLGQDIPEYQGSGLRLWQQSADQRRVTKLKILLEVSKQLSSPEENDKLLEKILDLLFKIMDVDRAVILMVNPETGQLERKAVKFRAGIPADDQFYSTQIANFVRKNGETILTADACIDFPDSLSVLQQAIRASMCVPLKPRAEVIGVLYADNLSRTNLYSEEDLEFLICLANTAAIAIDNANLYQKMQAEAVMRVKIERFFPQAVIKKIKESGDLEIVDTEVTVASL